MPERTLSAFATPSAIFLGIALHELISTFFFLVSASKTSWSTSLFQISVVAWSLCMLQSILQIVLLDYTISPYETANHSMAWLAVMVVRLRVFHSGSSLSLWLLSFIGFATFCFSVPANILGILSNVDVVADRSSIFFSSPLIGLTRELFAFTFVLQGLFTSLASISFLWSLCKSIGFTGKGFVYQVLLKREGPRFIVIFGLNIIVAGFAVHSFLYDPTHVTFSGWYMPPMIYAIEIYTFLLTSYVEPRSLLQQVQMETEYDGNNMKEQTTDVASQTYRVPTNSPYEIL
ncbi:hypothetical protein BATDEDRAFT_27306 [Batrachochytrium dendrobatidis JAM81]|uniref:Uncharacterized protein n=1 Tax=Batrachochytrium dendrobatidis (strain JAM81 / FGSC 10211) TaxID=684364 RepID=F4PAG2_BATDJ|nr:uncharacterized protein BATDEDRAFT_27306 [Batrachochytrium dendrobatidis JAM81]EGF77680.1 hypothetical protein BATDEDRAFT_27306 [Batrachochytrium dendrobatidis JAM81]|eukprot:XP_006681646.1 hypothetical protein BATDEDRAFT_27306 [Batrachochytrium dendrobatidis JAM81]